MNHITLTGHLGRNALLRTVTLPKGPRDVLNFSLAVRTGWGEAERTIWYDCSLWGDRSAKLAPYLLKGTRVLLTGSPDSDFAELAILAADQAGMSADEQHDLRRTLIPECAACGGTVEYHRNAAGDLYESCSHVGTHGRNDSAIRFVPERTA